MKTVVHLARAGTMAAFAFAAATASGQTFQLTSPDFGPDKPFGEKFIFAGLGCSGGNVSPALHWDNPPHGTKSFALMVHDPDAITGGAGIWHWVVINIPASARSIEQGAGTADGSRLPPGSRPIGNDYETTAWGGPCPPKGHKPHAYNFTLYALGVEKIDLPPNATASHAGFLVNRAAIAKATWVGSYGR